MPDFTHDPTLQACMHIISSLSIVACLAVFVTLFRDIKLQTTVNLIICMSVFCDLFLSVAFAFGTTPLTGYDTNVAESIIPCYVQGVTIHFMFMASTAWNALIPLHCFLLLRNDGTADPNKNMAYYHTYAWGMGTLCTVMLFVVQKAKGGFIIGNAVLECWIASEFAEYRIYLFYMFLWIQLVAMIVLYGLVFYTVKSTSEVSSNLANSDAISRGMKRMLYKAVMITIGFAVTWAPASVCRILGALGRPVPYWLYLLQALTMPAHGLVDSLIFLVFAHTRQKPTYKQTSSSGNSEREAYGGQLSLSEQSKMAQQIEMNRMSGGGGYNN
ncbi:hypothetical protein CcCBS67573_g05441 [Chytriomyces confervae]|uniref:G-protein coupled receptors family 2 profile 2 domain-containing protein n=1 Tax=Chytriomyces confervae TaxID=246404 RepID=A0A507FAR9_9FUNG|nr:hypothetical protein CcCBS67573_g05441 [Chytriomyces confervae]